MNFASDNASGAAPRIWDAIAAAQDGYAMPYGADDHTKSANLALEAIFEHECAVFFVPTGTAANALSLASLCPPWGAVFGHQQAHIMDSECGAPEFFTFGAKMVGVPGKSGKIDPAAFKDGLKAHPRGPAKQVQPAALSLSQATESGTVYSLPALAELSSIAHKARIKVHMDGARFANALVKLKASPAEMSWKAGIDVLSFGGTKNGTLMCEAVIFFDQALAADFLYRRKRGGHTVSKTRFLSAQMQAYLEGGYWLELAAHANKMAARLARGLKQVEGVKLPWPVDINEVFAILPARSDSALKKAGAVYYPWSDKGLATAQKPGRGETFTRLVTSFATTAEEVDQFIAVAKAGKS